MMIVRGLALALLFAMPAGAAGQAPEAQALHSYRRARAVLDAGIEAAGGEALIRGVAGIRREQVERRIDIGQQQRPWLGPPDRERQPAGDVVPVSSFIDYARGRWARAQHFDDGPAARFIQVDGGTNADTFSAGHYYDEPVFWHSGPDSGAGTAFAREQKRYPEGLLRLALERADSLTWIGARTVGRRRFDIIAFSDAQGIRLFLWFDATTGLLARTEGVRDHALLGDVGFETIFRDYRRVRGLMSPFDIEERLAGYPTRTTSVRTVDFAADAPDLFAIPARRIEIMTPPDVPTLHHRGGGVYEILGPYNVMFAVFDDYVLLAEAPVSSAYAETVLGLIASVAPGKPIRAVSTHFHYDHLGGVRALAARDIPILTTADARTVIDGTPGGARTIRPDGYDLRAHRAAVAIAGPLTLLADERQRVQIFHVGPGEHVADMLLVYFANTRTLFVADLWDVPTARQAIAGPDAELVMARVAELGLEVDRMVPVHGVPVSRAEIVQGLAIRRRHLGRSDAP